MANRIEALELWEGSFADPVHLIRHFEFFMKVDHEVLRCISEVHLSSVQGSPEVLHCIISGQETVTDAGLQAAVSLMGLISCVTEYHQQTPDVRWPG